MFVILSFANWSRIDCVFELNSMRNVKSTNTVLARTLQLIPLYLSIRWKIGQAICEANSDKIYLSPWDRRMMGSGEIPCMAKSDNFFNEDVFKQNWYTFRQSEDTFFCFCCCLHRRKKITRKILNLCNDFNILIRPHHRDKKVPPFLFFNGRM